MSRLLGWTLLGAALAGCDQAGGLRASIQRAVDRVYPAIVRIHVVVADAGGGRMRKTEAAGSGTIISPDGYVLTNHHVAGKARRLLCRLANREELEASLVGSDPLTDLAVLQLDVSGRDADAGPLPYARFGDSDALRVGDTVLAMGSPGGLSQSVTRGVVANTQLISPVSGGFVLDGEPVGALVRWIGHDAVIYHGNSGGPLVDLHGRIVGVNEVGLASLGGAIPSNLARDVARQLIDGGDVQRSWIGLDTQPLLKSMDRDRGVLVAGVIDDGPAAEAGIQPGDVILSWDGVPVRVRVAEELPLFNRLVLSTPVGAEVPVRLVRDGAETTVHLRTAVREPARGKDRPLQEWGITAQDFTRRSALEFEREVASGVLVSTVAEGGPASEAKPPIGPGDVLVQVDETPVRHLADLERVTREITAGQDEPVPALVAFERGKLHVLTVVRVGLREPKRPPRQARKAWIGVITQVLTRKLAKALGREGTPGVRVIRVLPNTNADRAGLQVGDLLLELDGRAIPAREPEHAELFDHMVRQYPLDGEVQLTIVRDGQERKVTVPLQPRPRPPAELDRYEDRAFEFTAREMSFLDRAERELDAQAGGVLIDSVQTAGWAALAGLHAGDVLLRVDGEPVADIADLERRMDAIRQAQPKRVVFFIRRGIHSRFVELEPDWSNVPGAAPRTDAPKGGPRPGARASGDTP